MHWLRRSNETYLIPLFFRRYFPTVDVLKTFAVTDDCPLWLRGMSQAELGAYDVIRGKVMQFLEDAEQWEEAYFKTLPCVATPLGVIALTIPCVDVLAKARKLSAALQSTKSRFVTGFLL